MFSRLRDRWIRGRAGTALAGLGAMALLSVVAPNALADPGGAAPDGYPSQQQVRDARADVSRRATAVADIRAGLALADQRLEAAATRAEQASEAYNGARWRLQQARAQARKAAADAKAARANVTAQRDSIAGLVASTYIGGGTLQSLEALVGADGPRSLMDRTLAYEGASTQLDARLERFRAASSLADVFETNAQDARDSLTAAADQARRTRDAATGAAATAQAESDHIADRKNDLIAALAKAEGISVALARQRQDALAEAARKQAEAEARQQAAADRKAEEARAAKAAKAAKESKAAKDAAVEGEADPTGSTAPAPSAPDPPAPAKGAAAAIAFARAQLGEPYRWGAAGPDSWDCSGLMMMAWRAGGASLPHYSAAQYEAGTPLTVGQLRPGDLVFWGSSPSAIHHVAMYLGNGLIIHAPRTGKPVQVNSMYYWVAPNYFARVG